MTLRLRFGIASIIVIVVLVALGIVIARVVTTSQIAQVDQQLTSALPRALNLAKGTTPPKYPSINAGKPFRSDVTQRFSSTYIAVIDAKTRRVLVSLGTASAGPKLPSVVSVVSEVRVRGRLHIQTVGSLKGKTSWRALLIRHQDGEEVLVAASLTAVNATDGELQLAMLLGGATLVIIMAALGWWLVRLGLNPIAEVTSVADAITAGDRSRRVRDPGRESEAAHLARAFNVMLDEEQAAEDHLRRFIADASHELRTPVTVMQGVADLWRQGALSEPGAIDDAMRRVGQESKRMAALVEDLLLLARLDEGRPLGADPIDLSKLARNVVADLSPMYLSHETQVVVDNEVMTTGDAMRLRQLLSNLLANAYLHTPGGTHVRLEVHRENDRSVLEVTDDGPGMTEDDGRRAFERFWRGNPSRSGPGSGLGLSIVASIVAAHKGKVELTTAPGEGTKIRITFPAAMSSIALVNVEGDLDLDAEMPPN